MTSPAIVDAINISSISKKITEDQLMEIIKYSQKAEDIRKIHQKTSILSKMPNINSLCPDSFDPNDTILCKLGKGKHNGGIGNGGKIGDPTNLTIIDDAKMPYYGCSNGPNGILVDCQNKYGSNRINLFYKSIEETKKLLDDYITFRNENLNKIFEIFVDKLIIHKDSNYLIDITKNEEELDDKYRQDFDNICEIFSKLLVKNKNSISLNEMGIAVVSYCQTWIRGDVIGNAQFSVMSPHFQTRFYVVDNKKFMEAIENKENLMYSYVNTIKYFTEISKENYGGEDGPAFINLDYLYKILE